MYAPRAIQNIGVPSRVATPILLTPGVATSSPVGSFTQRGKWTDLDKFYDDDDDDNDIDGEESGNEEESDEDSEDTPLQETIPPSDDGDESEPDSEETSEDDNDGISGEDPAAFLRHEH